MESIQQTFNGTTGYGNTVTATISKMVTLLEENVLRTCHADSKPAGAAKAVGVCGQYGSRLIKECEIKLEVKELTDTTDTGYPHTHS